MNKEVEPLTDIEVDSFLNYIFGAIPNVQADIEKKKTDLIAFREKSDLSDGYTTEIEKRTEELCKLFALVDTWSKVLLSGISFEKRQNPWVCAYVRTVNKIYKLRGV